MKVESNVLRNSFLFVLNEKQYLSSESRLKKVDSLNQLKHLVHRGQDRINDQADKETDD